MVPVALRVADDVVEAERDAGVLVLEEVLPLTAELLVVLAERDTGVTEVDLPASRLSRMSRAFTALPDAWTDVRTGILAVRTVNERSGYCLP